MQARMKHPVQVLPAALEALQAVNKAIESSGLPAKTLGLAHLRASQINGCSVCVDMHWRMMRKEGETDERMFAVAAWRDVPYFTEPERALLALTESLTRLADSSDPVPDAIWNEASRHFDERALAALLLGIAQINVWNRLNIAVRQPVGAWK